MTIRQNGGRRFCRLACGAVGGAAIALALVASSKQRAPADDPYRQLARFGAVLELVRDKYVDRPDQAKLIEAALRAMAGSLDPHSGYVSETAYGALESALRGEVGTVGLAIGERGGFLTVDEVMDGTSASVSGIAVGDRIEAIDGEDTRRLSLDQAAERMRGPANSSVQLIIRREPGGTAEAFEVLRDFVKTRSIELHVESGDVGYIRIPQFIDSTADDLRRAMATLRAEIPPAAFKGYVLDLRNNPGGRVLAAIATVNDFVDRGTIVSTRGRAAGVDQIFAARSGEDRSEGNPLVVLINGGSASAAEIVAGALQDLRRATLIGTRSFGKGSMQITLPLGDGALQLTTALYFTPSGRSIQARGIDPDIEVSEDVPVGVEAQETGESSLSGHLRNPRGERLGSPTYVPERPQDDRQLIAAIDVLHRPRDTARSVPLPAISAGSRLEQPAQIVGRDEHHQHEHER